MSMIRLPMEPRTPAWFEIRNETWTASSGAVLCVPENARLLQAHAAARGIELRIGQLLTAGVSSFFDNTPWTLWADKQGRIPKFKGNAHTERGVSAEENVIQLFEKRNGFSVEREVTALAHDDQWMLASFDGLVPASTDPSVVAPNGFPLEAKCPAFPSRKKLWDSLKEDKLGILGLPYYWVQVQHQTYVADAPYGWFVAAGQDEATGEMIYPIIEKVPRDDLFLEEYVAMAKYFYETFIYTGDEPPKLPSDEALIYNMVKKAEVDAAIASGDMAAAAELYLATLAQETEATNLRKELEAKLTAAAREARALKGDAASVVVGDAIEVSFSTTRTTSWKAVAERLAGGKVDPDILKECTSADRESVKIRVLAH